MFWRVLETFNRYRGNKIVDVGIPVYYKITSNYSCGRAENFQ